MEDRSVMTGADTERTCYYNDGVGCDGHSLCSFCGWNPKERDRRIEILREMERHGETPHVSIQTRRTTEL